MASVHLGGGMEPKGNLPDVRKTPTPGGAVPTPFPQVGAPEAGAKVKVSKEAFMKESSRALAGMEAGTGGGILSNVIKGSPSFLAASFKVKKEGTPETPLAKVQPEQVNPNGLTFDSP